jgi:hypothetical protein
MIRLVILALSALWLSIGAAFAQCAIPYTLTNGTTADASQVMTNFNIILGCVNANAALRGYLSGLTLANDPTSPNTVLDIATGVATSDDATTAMAFATAVTKNANAAWTVGTANGCLDTGSSLTAATWYHVFIIERTDTGVVDQLCSSSLSSPTMPTSYTKKRRIGSFRTNSSSQIIGFAQNGDEFLWKTSVLDVNVTNLGTTQTAYTLTVPPGLEVWAHIRAWCFRTAGGVQVFVTSPDATGDTLISGNSGYNGSIYTNAANQFDVSELTVRTNASSQINAVSGISSTGFAVTTYGWIDRRGRDN